MTAELGANKIGVRVHVSFSWETWAELVDYLVGKYGRKRGLSLTVDKAVRDFLARENQ